MNPAKRIGLLVASLHAAAVLGTMLLVWISKDPQASLIWSLWAIVDFPISLIYLLAGDDYSKFLEAIDGVGLAQALYLPHVIHGFFGTLWWYFLPRLLLSRRLGGIWGKDINSDHVLPGSD
jgi:hypothetical protein